MRSNKKGSSRSPFYLSAKTVKGFDLRTKVQIIHVTCVASACSAGRFLADLFTALATRSELSVLTVVLALRYIALGIGLSEILAHLGAGQRWLEACIRGDEFGLLRKARACGGK